MSALVALIQRDLKLAARSGGALTTLLAFYLGIGIILPIAIGPDKNLLSQLGPALIWTGVLLSSLIGIDRIFSADQEDGSLLAIQQSELGLSAYAFGKFIVHWLTTALPLIALTPVMAILFSMNISASLVTLLTLLIGTPALAILSLLAAALSVGLKRGGMIAPILVMPLAIPLVIFGVGAIDPVAPGQTQSALLMLSAISLLFSAFGPFAAGLALKLANE